MEFRNLKLHLENVFLGLQQFSEAGELPPLTEVGSLVQLAEKMHMNAPDDWLSEAEDFLHLTRQLHLAVKHGNIQDAVLLLDALQDAQEYCHRTYREK
jgi:XXXCH domain-containing protein